MRAAHLEQDLENSHYTADLFKQYRKHLGLFRYALLREGQILVVPQRVRTLLGMRSVSVLSPVLRAYKLGKKVKIDGLLKEVVLPPAYKKQIKALDIRTGI
jgi:hypothetical protein